MISKRVDKAMAEAVESIAQSIRVHCAAQSTRATLSEPWIMDCARNAAMAMYPIFLELYEAAHEDGAEDL